jgi:hypothetical protein
MAVNYATALKDDRMISVITRLDAQSGVAKVEICTAAYATVLSTISLAKPSFTETGGVITMAGAPKSDSSAANTGTAALARLKDSAGTVWIQGLTCGVGSGDLQLNSLSITAGQTVSIVSATITHSA